MTTTAEERVLPSTTAQRADEAAARLRAAGLRVTRRKTAVLAALDAARGEHLAASALHARVDGLSLQGLYDCLDALVGAGLARRLEPAGSPALYEARVGDNHHHLVCRSCGAVRDVDCLAGDAFCLTPATTDGFVLDEAEVTFWGLCPACAARPTTSDGGPRPPVAGTIPSQKEKR